MSVYYNDNDPFAVAWLRQLIDAGHLPAGEVDGRPIQEIQPADVRGFTQCHFFAGIGGWAYALQLAEWGDRPVWTGSCPCQPFSAAGSRTGFDDDRHLWPEWARLIRECRPATVFGEQVARAVGWGWLDLVSTDLEAEGYAVGATVLPACGVGAPHKRERLWFVAQSRRQSTRGSLPRSGESLATDRTRAPDQLGGSSMPRHVADREQQGRQGRVPRREDPSWYDKHGHAGRGGAAVTVANGHGSRQSREWLEERTREQGPSGRQPIGSREDRLQPWASAAWLTCRDGKVRLAPAEPTLFPLAHGVPNRMGTLRGAGNAIVPQVAATFVRTYMEVA